ncbi:20207_t:CDS:2 [Entrophospora sp. SA101]|nr:7499_t:CDS:2 [Entrophospora sp. SA101]CAJ0765331.1 20207_t:CDS:2 [Entrophospora sp. SA101]
MNDFMLCIHGVCAFECLGNSDCPQEGKCDSNLCKWSDELTPTTTKEVESPSSSSSPTTTTTSLNNLSTSSVAPEMRSTSKNNNNEEFEETFAEGAVGYSASENLGDKSFSHIQSQTVYGNSASATSMIELQTASHLPVLQEHHFMSQDGYISPQP